jgi:hypothetical protein
MFQAHPDFEETDDNTLLWRYQDLPRYIDLLIRRQLFFNRADKFEDPFEGKYNKYSKEALITDNVGTSNEKLVEQQFNALLGEVSEKRMAVTVNPWHENEHENYAMWNIYARGSYGLAIQTTYERLKRSFDPARKPVHIGKVIYYDEHTQQIPVHSSFAPFLWKRNIYKYENEVRCCALISDAEKDDFLWEAQDKYSGVFVPVDMEMLIERIYISPYSPHWFRDLVERLTEQFGIHAEIVHSAVFNSENFY